MPYDRPPTKFAETTRAGFERKANHNKTEALWCFGLVVASTLVAPVFVMLAHDVWLGKVLPSVLSLFAAGLTTWLQLRKPQQLWALYRTCQRRIEDAQTAHEYGYGEFEVTADRDQLLAKRVAEVAMYAHEQWVPLIPNPENVGVMTDGNGRSSKGELHVRNANK
jgi:hypothetical protein